MKILLLFVGILLLATKSYACSCMRYDIKKAYEDYDVVFAGEVVRIKKHWAKESGFFSPYKIKKPIFKISKSYKGVDAREFEVVKENHSAACGYPFEVGVEYAVFAYFDEEESKYRVSSCSPTIQTGSRNDPLEEERKYVLDFLNSQ